MRYKFPCGCEFEIENESIKDYDGLPSIKMDMYNLPLNCKKTWNLISSGRTRGVFQLESNLGRSYSKKLEPDKMAHLSALISLLRPGCLNALLDGKSMTNHYVDRKHGREPVTYTHPLLEKYLSDTYGILVYQEQAIAIAKGIAGFTPEQANALRKAIGKKKADVLAKLREIFINGCISVSGFTKDVATELFNNIESSNRYAFNACISQDTLLTKRSVGNKKTDYTVEHMFNIKNDIQYAKKHNQLNLYKKYKFQNHYGSGLSMYEDNRIRPNTIKDIRYAGEKEVFKISLDNGNFIKVTHNHKFPTPNGEKLCSELSVGDYLYTCGEYEKNTKNYKYSDLSIDDLRNKKTETNDKQGFQTAQKNPGYTNGSFTDFKKNSRLLPNFCEICSKKHRRLETHHKNGDRTNSKIDNLIRLCPSCHKKEEYKFGRVKVGEKGYPVLQSKIISIVSCGIEKTYDVEMEAPNHNFIANGDIVTCNSHAYTYAHISYATAYAKAHFPLHFFTSALKFVEDNDELRDLMSEVAVFDLQILGPSISNLLPRFNIKDGFIQYGLAEVKKSGEKEILSFIEHVISAEKSINKEVKDFSWYEFLILLSDKIKRDALINLIMCGLLDNTGISRKTQLHEFGIYDELSDGEKKWVQENWQWCNTLEDLLIRLLESNKPTKKRKSKVESLLKALQNPGRTLQDNVEFVCDSETEAMGISVSMNRTADKERFANIKCLDFLLGSGSKNMTFVVEVKSVEERVVKTGKNEGKKYANIVLSDRTGQIEATIFTKEWLDLKSLLVKGNVILLNASRNQDLTLRIENVKLL